MASSNGSGWLGGPKKLWSSLTSEVSNMFTEPQHASNKYDEQRVGQQPNRNFMNEFDQQLSRELGSAAASPNHSRYPSQQQPYINSSSPSPHYQQQQQIASPSGSWNGTDMINPALPAYQQQQLHHIPSAQPLGGDPNYPQPQQQQQQQPYTGMAAPATHPYYPSPVPAAAAAQQPLPSSPYPPAAAYPPPSNQSPGFAGPAHTTYPPRSPATPVSYSTATHTSLSPAQPTPLPVNGGAAIPSPYSPHPAGYASPLPPPPTTPQYNNEQPYPQVAPYPAHPGAFPPQSGSEYAAPPQPSYMGPSYTSASYSSAAMGALPPPPPSSYWVNRAAQQQSTTAAGGSVDGGGAAKVDYSDLDYSSMDFAYARKNR